LYRTTDIDVLFVNWRDVSHPEGGGSERYVQRIAEGLAATGLRVTLLCAEHGRAPREETVNGVRIVRRGGRLSIYPRAMAFVRKHRPRLVVDVQNGIPFCSTLATRSPVTTVVFHVHKEQWPIVFGRIGGRIGWWLESVAAPKIYRRVPYVTISDATGREMSGLGIAPERITLVPVGTEPIVQVPTPRSTSPRLITLGRLVPHKQVEHSLEILARLSDRWPDLTLAVVGEGWWEDTLRAQAERLGVADRVEFLGFLDETGKHEQLAAAWVFVCPSIKEGWGMVVIEAGGHGVPTVGYRSSGGLQESVVDGVSGVLVDDLDQMTEAVGRLLEDADTRRAMGQAAVAHAATFEWSASVREFAGVLARSVRESSRPAVREDLADLVARLEQVQHGTGDVTREPATRLEAAVPAPEPFREPASSGLP
jgi:glycosyltransferase involved in cell wall biosynthesis